MLPLRDHACRIWQAAVTAADPFARVRDFLSADDAIQSILAAGGRVLVSGGGKAGPAMAAGVEAALAGLLDRVSGLVNVPAGSEAPLKRIQLRAARPAASNHPTAEGVAAVEEQLAALKKLSPDDVGLCLLSGGGSALLPAPVAGVSLADKQEVTRLLHACGATIDEMNCVRKHLSRLKGGRLAQAFADRKTPLITLIVSDVVGDPLDVIASGPTAPDPTTFADALSVLERFGLMDRVPASVLAHLRKGAAGEIPETLKRLPEGVRNHILCNNATSLAASAATGEALGYRVVNFGSFIEGETRAVAVAVAGVVRSIRHDGVPAAAPVCLLSGGETTVTLGPDRGKGGRNQEFVLALLARLGEKEMPGVVILSGGTDGEDGPTDAAGAIADADSLRNAAALGLNLTGYLDRHDAYSFFDATGDLLRTGLTGTNVMDVRVVLVGKVVRTGQI
jgi:hydroxypyruvate reductase/glycerate 2-kinase